MKKYIIYSLKRYIPLFVVTFAVCFFTFIVAFGGSIPTSIEVYREAGGGYYSSDFLGSLTLNSGLIYLAIPASIFSMILPFFANSYRYSLQSADTFYQIGKNKKSIRWVNNILLLVAFIVSFSVAYLFAVLILLFRQLPNIGRPDEVIYINEYAERVTHYLFFNFGWYLPAYLLFLVFIVLNYAISYFLITRANNLVNSILMLIIGEGILAIGVMTPIWYSLICGVYAHADASWIKETFWIGTRTSCFVGPIAYIIYIFDGLITGDGSLIASDYENLTMKSGEIFALVLSILCLAVFLAAAALGIYKFLTEKESSGELAGKPVGRDRFQLTIFHMGFGLLGLWIGTLQSLIGSSSLSVTNGLFAYILLISEMGFYSAGYYVLHGLIRRNFRLNKNELILMISIIGVNLINGLALLTSAIINNTYL